MLEFIPLDHPIAFPHYCIACGGGQQGPVLDTHREVGGLRVYLCRECVKRSARIFGFTAGERLDELAAAAGSLEEKERELAQIRFQLSEANDVIWNQGQYLHVANDEVEGLQARVNQLETTIRETAVVSQQHMSLIGSTDAA